MDFGFEVYVELLLYLGLDVADEFVDVGGGGVVGVDDEAAVFFAHLRAADSMAAQTGIHDELAGKVALGAFESGAGARHVERLLVLAALAVVVHVGLDHRGVARGEVKGGREHDKAVVGDAALAIAQVKLVDIELNDIVTAVGAVVERTAARTSLEVQSGGGIKNREALHSVFDAGARRAICGSVAVRRPDLFAAWLAEFGPGRLILGADVRNGAVAIEGWLESSTLSAPELIGRFIPQGLTQVICTDISRDGMLCGPSAAFYADLQGRFPTVEITVSGGISSMSDIEELDRQGLRSVIVGKALYEGRITLKDLARCLPNA